MRIKQTPIDLALLMGPQKFSKHQDREYLQMPSRTYEPAFDLVYSALSARDVSSDIKNQLQGGIIAQSET